MTDKHCGKNDINELHVLNYKIGLNKTNLQQKNCTKIFFPIKILRGKT